MGKTATAAKGAASESAVKRGRGRPPKLTLEKAKEVGTLIARGVPEEFACIAEGVNYKTWQSAVKARPEISGAVKAAKAEFLKGATAVIASGVKGWQGAAWILERRHAEHFRRPKEDAPTAEGQPGTTIHNYFHLTENDLGPIQDRARELFVRKPEPATAGRN